MNIVNHIRQRKTLYAVIATIILIIGLVFAIYEASQLQTFKHNAATPTATCEVAQAQCTWDPVANATGYYVTILEQAPVTPTVTQAPTNAPTNELLPTVIPTAIVQPVTDTPTPTGGLLPTVIPTAVEQQVTDTPTPTDSTSNVQSTAINNGQPINGFNNQLVTGTSVVFPALPGYTYTCIVKATNTCGTGAPGQYTDTCPVNTPSPTVAPSESPTPTPTGTPVPTITPVPTNTPTITPTPTITSTPIPTATVVPPTVSPAQPTQIIINQPVQQGQPPVTQIVRSAQPTTVPTLASTGDTKPLFFGIAGAGILMIGGVLLFLL